MMYPLFLNLKLLIPMNTFFIHIIFICGFKEFFSVKLAFWLLKIVEGRGKLIVNLRLVKPEGGEKNLRLALVRLLNFLL